MANGLWLLIAASPFLYVGPTLPSAADARRRQPPRVLRAAGRPASTSRPTSRQRSVNWACCSAGCGLTSARPTLLVAREYATTLNSKAVSTWRPPSVSGLQISVVLRRRCLENASASATRSSRAYRQGRLARLSLGSGQTAFIISDALQLHAALPGTLINERSGLGPAPGLGVYRLTPLHEAAVCRWASSPELGDLGTAREIQ